jgi:acyl transferase domain-containing protein
MDTACSSGLVSLHYACQSLLTGECNAAIAGGVNIITSPDLYIGLGRGSFLSPTGGCKSFDASADGYCRGEGCGLLVLKRLADAIADRDPIIGTISASAVNQSGTTHSITFPHANTQANLYKKTCDIAGLHPHEISVVEAHGTGTQAGDPIEMQSIRTWYAQKRDANNPLFVGSVKANIGHAETVCTFLI